MHQSVVLFCGVNNNNINIMRLDFNRALKRKAAVSLPSYSVCLHTCMYVCLYVLTHPEGMRMRDPSRGNTHWYTPCPCTSTGTHTQHWYTHAALVHTPALVHTLPSWSLLLVTHVFRDMGVAGVKNLPSLNPRYGPCLHMA